jgi:hypothetical protein
MVTKPKTDLVSLLEAEIRKRLRDKATKPADRIKLIEAGVKVSLIRHKIEGGGGVDGSFFATPK